MTRSSPAQSELAQSESRNALDVRQKSWSVAAHVSKARRSGRDRSVPGMKGRKPGQWSVIPCGAKDSSSETLLSRSKSIQSILFLRAYHTIEGASTAALASPGAPMGAVHLPANSEERGAEWTCRVRTSFFRTKLGEIACARRGLAGGPQLC